MKKIIIFLIASFIISLQPTLLVAADLALELSGRILLQVESHGEAWYINPDNNRRYYLGRPADAFNLMRELGVGITNADLANIPRSDSNSIGDQSLVNRLKGKILLQVEANGEAWYVNPNDGKRYYLGRPNDAFGLMRELGLGISDANLGGITVEQGIPVIKIEKAVQNNDPVEAEETTIETPIETPTEAPVINNPSVQPEPNDNVVSIVHQVSIEGDAECQRQNKEAMDYLYTNARTSYDFFSYYIGLIRCTEGGVGVYVWEDPVRFDSSRPTREAGLYWYASVLVHEACHSWQYSRYPERPVPHSEYYGEAAESECINIQYITLEHIDAPEYLKDHLKNALSSKYWEVSVEDRWW